MSILIKEEKNKVLLEALKWEQRLKGKFLNEKLFLNILIFA